MKRCTILNTNINVTNMDEVLQMLDQCLEEKRGDYICVANVHTTVMAFRDEKYRKIQNESWMTIPDGKPLSLVSRKRGFTDVQRVPGPDLMVKVFEASKEKGYRHFFYGSTDQTLRMLRENIEKKYPYVDVVGMYSPPFRPLTEEEDQQIITMINETNPDFVWVGLGAPKQEIWMAEHKNKIQAIMIGVGAAFDFEAGVVKRAPKWMQEMYLEWLHRILQDPKRLIPRYVSTNAAFLWNVYKEGKQIHKNQIKIAMIGHKRIPSREGGVEIVVYELARRLVKKGYRVDAYNRKGHHVSGKKFMQSIGKNYEGIRIITIPTFESSKLNAIVYSILATIRALFEGYDVIHFHAEGPCAMIWLPKLFRIHCIATIHGLDWQRAKWGNFASGFLKFGEKMAVKYADEVIVLSDNMKQYFKQEYGRETVYIPNGISKPERREADQIRQRWMLEEDSYILFLARIVPEKGVHYLISAYQKLETDKKLVIAGGSSHSLEYYEELKEMAKDNPNIVFTNFVGGQVLEELFSNAYCFVLPSDVEGMAIGLLEAMSYGNCCLVSDIKENAEVVGEYAEHFKHSDVESLREHLCFLLEHPEAVRNYKENASDYICRKYSWDKVVDETRALYAKVLE